MFRLVIVSGPNRGSSFTLIEGENSIGRQMDNHIVLTSAQVSKRHCSLLLNNNEVFLRDGESTNGTFINGALAKKQKLKSGDRIGVGNFVMELVQVGGVKQASPISMAVSTNHTPFSIQTDYSSTPSQSAMSAPLNSHSQAPVGAVVPDDLPGKLNFFFEGRLMPTFYGQLLKTELKVLMSVLIFALVLIAVVASVMPTLDLAEQSIQREALIRAKVLARETGDRFLPAVSNHAGSQIDLSLLENEESVKMIAIVNLDMQIIAPQSRLSQVLAGGREASYAMKMAKEFREGRERGAGTLLNEHTAVYVEPLKTVDPRQVKSQIIAMVIVSIDFSGNLIQSGGMGVTYGTALMIAGLAGVLIFFILFRLFLKPFEVLNDELDQVLRGELPKVTREFKISELANLWENINSAAQRGSKGAGSDVSMNNQELNWENEFASIHAISSANDQAFVGFDSNFKIVSMNSQFEEVTGIRMDAMGQTLSQVARDQAFVALVQDVKERVAGAPSRSVLDETEFGGVAFQVIAAGIGNASNLGVGLVFRKKG